MPKIKGGGFDGGVSNEIQQLLEEYKGLIDFSDQTQKNNFKHAEAFIKFEKRKRPETWEEESQWFLREAIDLHKRTFGKRR